MIKRLPRNILSSFINRNKRSKRAICRLLNILIPVKVKAEKGMIDMKSTIKAPFRYRFIIFLWFLIQTPPLCLGSWTCRKNCKIMSAKNTKLTTWLMQNRALTLTFFLRGRERDLGRRYQSGIN